MTTPLDLSSQKEPGRLSAACQQIASEDFSNNAQARVVIRSTIADPELWPVISLHKCNGVCLTPSGLYADMAATVAQYVWKNNRGVNAESPGINVCDLDVDKTLIAKVPQEGSGQWIEMESQLETPPDTSGDILSSTLRCTFRSIRPDGTKMEKLAHCSVKFEWWPGWVSEWSHFASVIQNKIDNLTARARTESGGRVQLVYRERAYELFKSFVDYSDKYQNMAEVIFDTETREATSLLAFHKDFAGDLAGPYHLDGSCHVSGFVCNAVEQQRDKNAYISHGIDAMKLAPTFDPTADGEIRNYVRMQTSQKDKTILAGDVYVLQGGQIVGVWEGVKFKKIPRKVLNVFLPPPK